MVLEAQVALREDKVLLLLLLGMDQEEVPAVRVVQVVQVELAALVEQAVQADPH